MDFSFFNVMLLLIGVVLFILGTRIWRHRRYTRTFRLGAWLCAVGAGLAVLALILIFREIFFWPLDHTWMDLGWFTGWAHSLFLRVLLVCAAVAFAASVAYIWRVRNHRKRRAAHLSPATATTH